MEIPSVESVTRMDYAEQKGHINTQPEQGYTGGEMEKNDPNKEQIIQNLKDFLKDCTTNSILNTGRSHSVPNGNSMEPLPRCNVRRKRYFTEPTDDTVFLNPSLDTNQNFLEPVTESDVIKDVMVKQEPMEYEIESDQGDEKNVLPNFSLFVQEDSSERDAYGGHHRRKTKEPADPKTMRRRKCNRIAAKKCREKKKVNAENLHKDLLKYEDENVRLSEEIRELQKEFKKLEEILKVHSKELCKM